MAAGLGAAFGREARDRPRLARRYRVPDRSAHEVHLEAGRGEAPAHLGEDGGQVDQLAHGLLHGGRNRLTGGAVPTGPELSRTTGLHIPVDSGVAAAFLR